MKLLVVASLLLTACATVPPREAPQSSAALVVQRQLDAYNARDIDAFVATYSDDVEVYRPPSATPILAGRQRLREFYLNSRFNIPTLHAALLHRSVVGNKVVDHERITGLGSAPVEAIVAYMVRDGLIQRVWIFNPE